MDIGFDFFSYTNVLIVNSASKRQIYMTSFADYQFNNPQTSALVKQRDQLAKEVYESLGFEVIITSAPDFPSLTMGGLHCATRTWPAKDPNADINPKFFSENMIVIR